MKKTISKVAGLAVLVGLSSGDLLASNVNVETNNSNLKNDCLDESFNITSLSHTRAFIKQSLSKEGFKTVYNNLIRLNESDRRQVASLMREDFASFAASNFTLTRDQEICVKRYWTSDEDLQFIKDIANLVEKGKVVSVWNVDIEEKDSTPRVRKISMVDTDMYSAIAKKKRTASIKAKSDGTIEAGFSISW